MHFRNWGAEMAAHVSLEMDGGPLSALGDRAASGLFFLNLFALCVPLLRKYSDFCLKSPMLNVSFCPHLVSG